MIVTLIDELARAKGRGSRSRHKVARVLEKLDPAEAKALEEALTDPEYSSEALSRALGTSGHPIGSTSIRRYRRDVLGLSFE